MISWRIRKLEVSPSTNDTAKAAAESGEAEGLVIWALQQTQGRGRRGRVWESPQGNLYTSLLLRPSGETQNIGLYAFVTALAVADAVRDFLPQAEITLKWPNDVLVDGKKISGVLLEASSDWLVVGVGVNVMNSPSKSLYPCTSLHEQGAGQPVLDKVLDALLSHFAHWYDVMQTRGFGSIREPWLARAKTGSVTVVLPQETIAGTFQGIDLQGCLRLRLADGTERAIATGDVFFEPRVE